MGPAQSHEPERPSDDELIKLQTQDISDVGLSGYVKQFGFSIESLRPDQIAVFMAARGLEPYVKALKMPVAEEKSTGETMMVEREVDRVIEKTRYREESQLTSIPSDQMDVTIVEGPQDLPKILPTEWALEELAPNHFLRRLNNREILKNEWRQSNQIPETVEETSKTREFFEEPAPPKREKQHAYALIDVSGSMGAYDGRGIAAKGLALAFLRHGYEQRAHLNLRRFADNPKEAWTADDESGFRRIAKQLVDSFYDGGTDIQKALEAAARDIKKGGRFTRADVILISDGLSVLGRNPMGKVNLHTFLLGEFYDFSGEHGDSVDKLKEWSKSFKRIDPSAFRELMAPPREDLEAYQGFLKSIPERLERMDKLSDLKKLSEVLANLEKIFDQYGSALSEAGNQEGQHNISVLQRLLAKQQRELEEKKASMEREEAAQERHKVMEQRRIQAAKEREAARIAEEGEVDDFDAFNEDAAAPSIPPEIDAALPTVMAREDKLDELQVPQRTKYRTRYVPRRVREREAKQGDGDLFEDGESLLERLVRWVRDKLS